MNTVEVICHCPVPEWRIHGRHKHVSCRYVFAWCRSECPEKPILKQLENWCFQLVTGVVLCMVECAVSLALLLALACEMSGSGLEKETDYFFSKFPFYPFTQIKDKKTQNYTGSFYFILIFCYTIVCLKLVCGTWPIRLYDSTFCCDLEHIGR